MLIPNSNSILEDVFSSEVMRWRYFKALLSSFSLQLLLSTLVCNTINTIFFSNNWNPLIWIYYLLTGIIKPFWIFRCVFPACCYIILTRIHVHCYAVSSWIPDKRLQYFSQFLQLKKFLYFVALTAVCSLLLQHYTSIINPDLSLLTVLCGDSNEMCVNHQSLLIILIGTFYGCRISCQYFLLNFKSIQVPTSERSLLMCLKSKLQLRTIIEACSLYNINFGSLSCAYIAYSLLGGMISHWISPLLGVSSVSEPYSIWPVLTSLVDFRFLITLTSCLMLLVFNLHCFFSIFEEIVSQRIELPICGEVISSQSEGSRDSPWNLSNGLSSSCDLFQLLAFKHLKDISLDQTAWGRSYRTQVFAISQPGGHPRNWQSIVNPSLNLIRKFCDRLKQQNCMEEKPSSTQQATANIYSIYQQTDVNKNQIAKSSSLFGIKEKLNQLKDKILQFPLLYFLLSELPDAKNRQIFAEGQSIIWAVEGLSNLVATSYSDDRFGVVQKNISDVLTSLIQLQLVMEKVGRGVPYRRITQGMNFGSKMQKYPQDVQLRRALRVTLRTSLYTITNTFKESIRDIHTSEEVRAKLESYLSFQEG